MQAIITKYHGPGNVKGSRFIATSGSGLRVVVSYDYALDVEENHRAAAQALCDKLSWKGKFVSGGTKDGYAHVFIEEQSR
jgi:hypothetical protein